VIILNRSGIPDHLLYPVVELAGIAVHARTDGVVVRVSQSYILCWPYGIAYRDSKYPRLCTLDEYTLQRACLPCPLDGGTIKVTTVGPRACHRHPYGAQRMDWPAYCWMFTELVAHEWFHVREFQDERQGVQYSWAAAGLGGRRPRWETRPEEIRAQLAVERARLCDYVDLVQAVNRLVVWFKALVLTP